MEFYSIIELKPKSRLLLVDQIFKDSCWSIHSINQKPTTSFFNDICWTNIFKDTSLLYFLFYILQKLTYFEQTPSWIRKNIKIKNLSSLYWYNRLPLYKYNNHPKSNKGFMGKVVFSLSLVCLQFLNISLPSMTALLPLMSFLAPRKIIQLMSDYF